MNKTRMGKRVASLLLSLVMMLSLLPTAAYATMADGVDTQGASVSENGTDVSDDSNSSGNTDDLQVGDSKDSDGTGNQQVGGSSVSGTADDTTGTEGGADTTGAEGGNDSASVTPSNRVEVNGTVYDTLEAAIAAAEPVNGVITYEIYGKVEANSTESWIEVLKDGLTDVTKVAFVGKTNDAEISITNSTSVLADQNYDIDVSFVDLILSHSNGAWVGDLGHATEYFTCVLRNTDAANNTVTYTNCTFPNGACNNQYGKTVFDNCKFTNATSGKYNLWNYGGTTEITNSAFTGTRGVKTYNEGTLAESPEVAIKDTTFTGLTEKAAIVASKPTDIKLDSISATECTKGVFQKDIEGSTDAEKVTIEANGSGISGNFNVTAEKTAEAAKGEFNITAGSFTAEVPGDYCAEGFTIEKNTDGSYGVKEDQPSANVAKVGDTEYATLEAAIAALSSSNYTLGLLVDSAWDEATPVYWAAGTQSGYVATLADALTAAYKASGDAITIVCRPGADVGKLTHGHVADNITIYGNNAYISSGECELEVDTFMYSRETGKQVTTGGAYLDKDITVTAYELDNLGVWGERHTDHKVTVNLTDCDTVNGITAQRVYISGTTGVNDITLTGCDFGTKATSVYSNADGKVVIDNCSFTGAQVPVNFNHKAGGTQTVTVRNSKFTNCGDNDAWKQFAAPVRFVNSGSGTMTTSVDTCTFTGTVGSNGDILLGDGRVGQKSNDVTLTVANTAANVQAQQPGYYGDGGTKDESKLGEKTVAAGETLTTSVNELVSDVAYVAAVGEKKFESLQAAIDKATEKATVILLADTRENVTISTNRLTLDLNGHTLNGGTVAGKPALTVRARNVIVKDSSEAKTGTIMREDTAENSGVSSHYVIDIQGKGAFLTFESGNVKNNSGNKKGNGASLVRVGDDSVSAWPQLTIAGGTFTQDNFIVIKVDRGTFYLTGGTLNSKNDYAVENWYTAIIKGGTVNGEVAAWTYSGGHNSTLTISDNGIVNGDVASVSYDKAEGKVAKVSITGGTVTGTLGTYTYDSNSGNFVATTDATKATIAVTGGTFKEDPTKYVVEDSGVTKNADGTYGVAKAYLAKVGDTSYYTMDEAFKAQTASGEPIVLLRDYTTGSTFNSGSINRTVDLDGHTWTCTGTDANSAAFEINYSDASLTVKNGKVVSSQLVGLIPSAMGGTIKYDNSSLVFDGVVMTTTARSGIETNGNNTNDTVTLKNSTLNVPNGFGIYFPSSGTLTIDNSVINAKTMGVQVCAGSLNISGAGTAITVSGDGIEKTGNDGAIEDGAAISIVERTGYKGLSEIKVSGGTFTAKAGNDAVKAYKWENQTASAFDNSKNVVAISGGTFSSAVDKSLCAGGYIPTQNADGTYGVKEGKYVAEIGSQGYESLQAAIDAAKSGAIVTLLADTRENVTIAKKLTLDLNGFTLNGGTEKGKPALTVSNSSVTVKDSSEAKTGTIMREDTDSLDVKGSNSHYVIDIQGKNGFLKFESGNVKNTSGIPGVKGASLIRLGNDNVAGAYPTLTITGGTFTQDNFIAIKVDRGTLHLLGGTVNSANSFAIENWNNAYIKGGTVNGTVSTWVYSTGAAFSKLTISGGTVNGNVASVNYDNAADKQARVYVTGGTVTGTLGTYTYNNGLVAMDETAKATIEVTGGTFKEDPTKYVVEDSGVTKNADGTYGVAKAYLAKVGDTSYYTMDEAFHAAVASGKTLTLLRDYTTGSSQNSGSKSFTIDLNGYTWTYTGKEVDCAAFEINYSDVTLTVKNGKVVSSQLAGLIPSAMSGTITYDNSGLVFENVEMTANGHSGIETNGNNTNDTVTLKDSTLNVPNGFGIYFPSSGTLTIDNSKINAKTMGVQVCSGSLNVTGAGTAITVSGDGIEKTGNDGAIEDGAAISIVERTGYKGLSEIKVSGGTFTAKAGNDAVKAYKWENQTASAFDNSKNVVAVSGGTFSSAVDKSLCADGFIPTKNENGTYGVKEGADGYVEDENGNVTISTAEGLFYFAKKVNAGNNFAGKTVTLANNIDLNNEKWTPIGIYGTQATWFKGTFDGQNHAVTGLKVEESRKNGVGFFGKVYTGTIKNLTVEGSVSAPGCNYVGGIVGHGYATITNCTFKGNVGSTTTMQVGGIAGSGGFTVTDCSVYGDVTAECWAGGIVGNCQDGGAYTNCYVEGTISSERTYWGGGAAGITPVPLYPSQVISGCYSNTVVKVAGEEVNCPIIACYNNPLDYKGYSGGLKIYDNSWNKQKNSNDSYPIYAEKDGKGGVLMEGMTAARDNSLIMLEDDLNYITGDLSKVRIMAGSSVTQAQIDALAVASVGDSKYQSLAEAIDAAQNGQTVTLLADATEDVVISKNITLDLGGKTLTNTNAGKATISVTSGTVTVKNGNVVGGTDYYNIEVTKDANLTLTDVTATAGNNGSSMIDNYGTLTITSGTYTGGLDTVKNEPNAKLTISGGTFTLTKGTSKGFTGVVFNYGELTISGGTFIQSDKSAPYAQAQVIHTDKSGSAVPSTVITGGTFKNLCTSSTAWVVRETNKAADATQVSGGTFNKEVKDYYCADGFIPTKNAGGTYGVKVGQYVAQVGSKKYETLADAIRLATKGKTITLLCDVEQNTQLTINKSITLDLNGKTIKISGYTAEKAQVSVKGNLTIQDSSEAQTGKICSDYTGTAGRVVSVENGGKLTIAGGTITTEGMSKSGSAVYIASGAEVNMTGGTVKVDAKRGNAAMNIRGSTGVFTMSGGSVIAEAGDGTETNITAISGISGSTIQISAGTVSGPQAVLAGSSATTITGGNFTGSITVKNGSISGGTFDRALDKKACAAGYVPADNGNGTYGVAVGKFTVKVTSRTTGSDSPVANVAGGGSDITYAEGTTVTASAISGYNFVGWFVNEYTGTAYSTDLTCEVKPTDDCTMIAVYEPISGGVFALEVSASKFTVNGGATQRSYLLEKMPVGTQVTVVFKGSENFLYWVNESGKVVSTSKTYTFPMGSATTLKAVYAEKEENQAMVVFISHTQQVISSKGYTDTQEIKFPEPPIKMGATFVRWSMTEAEIRAAMATTTTGIIVVEPVYEFNAGSYTVTVNYPNDETATYTATVGKITTVTAKSIDGKVFKCWKNGDTVLGYTETLKIAPRGDLTLTAEYVDAGTTVDRLPVIALTEISASQQGAKYAVSFTATRSVPEGYTVTEQGILVSTNSQYGQEGALDAMKLDANGAKPDDTFILKATNTDATGVTVLNGTVSAADRTVYGRAYMILRDSSGAMVYVYSDTILSGSYNSLTTNGGN